MRASIVVLLAGLTACESNQADQYFDQSDSDIQSLRQDISELRKELLQQKLEAKRPNWTNLQVNESGYSYIDAGGLPLAFALKEVRPSGNGSQATLVIGNPTNAKITRLYLDLTYGKSTADGLLTSPMLEKTETLIKPLPGGEWTEIVIGLPNMKPQDLGIVRINGASIENMTLLRNI